LLPALHLDRLQAAIGDEFGQCCPALRRFQAEVVAQVAFGRHAQGGGGVQHQALVCFGFARLGLIEDGPWQYVVRHIVEPLEATSPRHCHLACGEQPFQRMLLLAPVPPGAGPFLARRQAAGAQGPLFAHRRQHPGDHVLAFAAELRKLAVDATAVGSVGHAPAQHWVETQRQQRGLMAPVFEQLALAAAAPGELVEHGGSVVAQAGEQRQVVGADQGVDRVDLQHAQALQHALEGRQRRGGWRLLAEALGG